MEDNSLKKFDRIVAILIQLQSKRIVKAQEMADRFEVSLRTIYRDIKTLEQSGVPIIGEAGMGYSIMEGYRLPPIMFSNDEATSFIAAEKLMEQYLDKTMHTSFQSAMFKIKSVMKWAEKDMFDTLDENVKVVKRHHIFNESVPNALESILQGITQKKQVAMTYRAFDAQENNERVIEPIGLYHEYQHWYLIAYCFLRKDYRKFRTDRIYKIAVTSNDFENEHQNLDFYLKPYSAINPLKTSQVIWRVPNTTARYLLSSRNFYGFVSEEKNENTTDMTFEVDELHWDYLSRWYLMFADSISIIHPASFKESVQQLLNEIQQKMN